MPQMSHTRVTNSTANPLGVSGGSSSPFSSVAEGQTYHMVERGEFTADHTARSPVACDVASAGTLGSVRRGPAPTSQPMDDDDDDVPRGISNMVAWCHPRLDGQAAQLDTTEYGGPV